MASTLKDVTRIFLVTANIATCFEQPDSMVVAWMDELLKSLPAEKPGFIALHCQEVGGKNYQNPRNSREKFLSVLLARPELKHYTRSLIYLDGDTAAVDKFTALGSLYFIHERVEDIQTWDFKEGRYVDVEGRKQYTDDLSDASTKEKVKFPKEFFPECKWSRKGFMRTRWRIYGTELDLINIHLFHDASNFLAMKECPSVYSLNRRRALNYALDRFQNDNLPNVPFFIFGDFNFRLNTKSVIENLTAGCTSQSLPATTTQGEEERHYHKITRESLIPKASPGELSTGRPSRRDSSDCETNTCEPELVVSKRGFRHCRHQIVFLENRGDWLRPYDLEAQSFSARVSELPITFPPSYPFAEEPDPRDEGTPLHPGDVTRTSSIVSGDEGSAVDDGSTPLLMVLDAGRDDGSSSSVVGRHYAYTRLPAWCDRVLISKDAELLLARTQHLGARYDMLGLDTPMGDHKPVCLVTHLPHRQRSCDGPAKPLLPPLCLCHREEVCPAPPEWSLSLPKAQLRRSDDLIPSDCFPVSLSSHNLAGHANRLKSTDSSSVNACPDLPLSVVNVSSKSNSSSVNPSPDVPLSVANSSITDENLSLCAKKSVLGCTSHSQASTDSYPTDQSSSNVNPKAAFDQSSEINRLLSNRTTSLVKESFNNSKDQSEKSELESNIVNLTNLSGYPKTSNVKSDFVQSSIGLDDGDVEDCSDTTHLIAKSPVVISVSSACEVSHDGVLRSKSTSLTSGREDGECVSLTLSADTAELTDDASANEMSFPDGVRNQPKDLYSKLELMRKHKRSVEVQHSLNNLLVSDSGSEHVSLGPTAASLSSLSGVDAAYCRRGREEEESISQVNSDDSGSLKNRPSKDPESVSQFYASEDSASCDKTRLPKDYESISQSPTYDIADVDSINERTKSMSGDVRVVEPAAQIEVARKRRGLFKKSKRTRDEVNSNSERGSRRSSRCCCS